MKKKATQKTQGHSEIFKQLREPNSFPHLSTTNLTLAGPFLSALSVKLKTLNFVSITCLFFASMTIWHFPVKEIHHNLPSKHWDSPVGCPSHYSDVILDEMASHITSLTIVYSTVYTATDQRKHQSSASLAFVQGIHQGPVNSPHKWPVT